MVPKDSSPQEDIIELIDIIEEDEQKTAPTRKESEAAEGLDDLEDLFLFPGAAEDSRSLLEEMEEKDRGGDDDFPELDAIFEDLEFTSEPAEQPVQKTEDVPPAVPESSLELRIAALEERIGSLSKGDDIRRELDMVRESSLTRAAVAEMIEQAVQAAVSARDARINELDSEISELRRQLAERQEEVSVEPDMDLLVREMDERIEKAVPMAAARIIREEIAGLLKG